MLRRGSNVSCKKGEGMEVITYRERMWREDTRIPPQCFGGINILLIFTMLEVPAGMAVRAESM